MDSNQTENNWSLIPDQPIKTLEEDLLDRRNLSDSIARVLLSPRDNSSYCMLLNGEWGAGKTSLINLVKGRITQNIGEQVESEKLCPVFFDFAPWNAKDADGVIRQFFVTLYSHFKEEKIRAFIKKAVNSSVYQGILSLSSILTAINPWFEPLDSLVRAIKKYGDDFAKNGPKELEEYKEAINKKLCASQFRFIVFIDDLDRLNSKEIIQVIQLIKAVCDFKNITYVLSGDKTLLSRAFTDQSPDGDGKKYLEKIVQIEYDIPNPTSHAISQFAAAQGKDLLLQSGLFVDDYRFDSYLKHGLFSRFDTMRAAKRFLNQFIEYLEEFGHYIDGLDLMAMAYFRVVDDDAIHVIKRYSHAILGNVFKPMPSDMSTLVSKFASFAGERLLRDLFCLTDDEDFTRALRKKRICTENRLEHFLAHVDNRSVLPMDQIEDYLQNGKGEDLAKICAGLSDSQYDDYLKFISNYNWDADKKAEINTALDSILKNGRSSYTLLETNATETLLSVLLVKAEKQEIIDYFLNALAVSDRLALLYEILLDAISDSSYDSRPLKIRLEKDDCTGVLTNSLLSAFFRNNNCFALDNTRVLKYLLFHRESDLKQMLLKKDIEWLTRFLAVAVFMGSFASGDGKSGRLYYPMDGMANIVDIGNFSKELLQTDFNSYDKRTLQRALTHCMKADGQWEKKQEYDGGFAAQMITDYCREHGIDFTASDNYEG